jgi:hypothetical protein
MLNGFMTSLSAFCVWLEATAVSQVIQTVLWIVPTVQSIHIVAIAALMGAALMIDARLVGWIDRDRPIADVARRFLPVIWWMLPILLVTGMVMITGEPARSLQNPIFQTKVALILAAMLHLGIFQRRLLAAQDDVGAGVRAAIVLPSALIWLAIVFCGRWIAYY